MAEGFSSLWRYEFEASNAGNDQADAGEPRHARALFAQNDPENSRAEGADTGPDRVSCSQWQRLQGKAQQGQAGDHDHHCQQRWEWAREPLRVLQANSPANLEKTGREENEPSYPRPPRSMAGSSPPGALKKQSEVILTAPLRWNSA